MSTARIDAVTGAFGNTGKYITQILLNKGHAVTNLTNSTRRANDFGGQVTTFPFNFDDPQALTRSLQGVQVLYNTYWVRFNHALFNHEQAVTNSRVLFEAARKAGVERIVHISITNPSESSPLEYFSGKARLEKALIGTGIPYAILRPAVIFGPEDILINNIAWALRHLPVFGVFGDGEYKLQPVFVEDLARLAVEQGEKRENVIIDAIGPETFTYRGLVETLGQLLGLKRLVLPVSPAVGYAAAKLIGALEGDVLVTRPEIEGLMANLLYTDSAPAAGTKLTGWIREHAGTLGKNYASELKRRKDRLTKYPGN
ncbi:MAG TPA: NAD(P)H-binding protein [Anaerolineales bacterium]|jgi:NADH dehydrogenase